MLEKESAIEGDNYCHTLLVYMEAPLAWLGVCDQNKQCFHELLPDDEEVKPQTIKFAIIVGRVQISTRVFKEGGS